MDRLSVFGIVDPLKRLPELLKVRRQAFHQQLDWRPDCFLGIDSPDFNLTVFLSTRFFALHANESSPSALKLSIIAAVDCAYRYYA